MASLDPIPVLPAAHAPLGLADHAEEREVRQRTTDALVAFAGGLPDNAARAPVLDALVRVNLGVAESVARRFRGRGIDADDLRQSAVEALVRAVRRFDPDASSGLMAYIVPTIRGELQHLFRDRAWMVRPPRALQELHWQVGANADRLSQDLQRTPSLAEIAATVEVTPRRCREAAALGGAYRPLSLEAPLGEDDSSCLADLLADGRDADVIAAVEARVVLAPLLLALEPRQRDVLRLRFVDTLTQREIGDRLGMSQVQVSRLLTRTLADLRAAVGEGTDRT